MATYQQHYPQFAAAPARRQTVDVAAWALVAVIVAIVCAAAGWAIARQDVPGRDDLARTSSLAARDGAARGMSDGYRRGAAAGRQAASLRSSLQTAQAKREAAQSGWNAGFTDGQSRAAARTGDGFGLLPSSSAAYPSADWSDVLASGALDDVPGYADSSYSAFGMGAGVATPYQSTGSYTASTYGDDY